MFLFNLYILGKINVGSKKNSKIIVLLENYYLTLKMGIGDWGLGIGDWAQSPIPNPQSPIPK